MFKKMVLLLGALGQFGLGLLSLPLTLQISLSVELVSLRHQVIHLLVGPRGMSGEGNGLTITKVQSLLRGVNVNLESKRLTSIARPIQADAEVRN